VLLFTITRKLARGQAAGAQGLKTWLRSGIAEPGRERLRPPSGARPAEGPSRLRPARL